jgi:hypothetical protein
MTNEHQLFQKMCNSTTKKFADKNMGLVWEERWATMPPSIMPWVYDRPALDLVNSYIKNNISIKQKTLLELGCGNYVRYAENAIDNNWDVWASDISVSAITQAKANCKTISDKVHWVVGDVLDLNVQQQKFDLIIDEGCFHCFNFKEDRLKFTTNIEHCLNDQGLWITVCASWEDVESDNKSFLRRSLQELIESIEPNLKIVKVELIWQPTNYNYPDKRCWAIVSQKRTVPSSLMHGQ